MKFFVTGVGGQLGHDVMNELLKRGHEGVGSDIQENYSGVADGSAVTKAPYVALDITDKNAVEKVITEVNPDAVIHCAAWTAVDMAEDDDKVAKVRAINAGGTQNIANVCKKLDCKMTYISTDYVFDGQGTEPWQPDCKDYKPLNVYGQTKLEGELAVSQTLEKYFIVRIAWVTSAIKRLRRSSWRVISSWDDLRDWTILLKSWVRLSNSEPPVAFFTGRRTLKSPLATLRAAIRIWSNRLVVR